MPEAGCDAIQEVGFTLAEAIAYAEHFTARGLAFDSFAPRLSFHFFQPSWTCSRKRPRCARPGGCGPTS